jgi:hypothetical protein
VNPKTKSKSMKITDHVTKRILAVSFGLMGVILCATLFMQSIGPANATTSDFTLPQSFDPAVGVAPAAASGTIMMDYTSVHVENQDKTFFECMVWNTETGKSALYFYSSDTKGFKKYEETVQLPARPLD